MDIIISPPYHMFETSLPPEAREARIKTLRGNLNSNYSFRNMGSNNSSVSQLDIDISLKCAHLQNRLIYPVRTKDCIHLDCVDLTLLVYLICKEKKPMVCPICKKSFKFWENDIKIDTIIQQILKETRNDCTRVKYDLKKNNYYIIENEKSNDDSISMIISIIEENKQNQYGLEVIVQNLQTKRQSNLTTTLDISLLCALSGKRMNYPCRFSNCQHIECFDLEQLQYKFSESMKWKCPIPNCNSTTNNPKKDIKIDKTLLPMCLKYSRQITFLVYYPLKKKFYVEDAMDDPFLKDVEGDDNLTKNEKLKLINNAYDLIILYSSRNSHDALKDKLVPNDQEEIEIDLLDPVTGLLMEFPARITNCKHLEGVELKSYLSNWAKGEMKCPRCDEEFEDPENDLYVDTFLSRALVLQAPRVIYRRKEDIFIDVKQKMYKDLLLKLEEKIGYDDIRYQGLNQKNFMLNCFISDKLMKIPVTMRKCRHPACFDLGEYAKLDPEKRPTRCPYPLFCGISIDEKTFVRDQVVEDILDKVSKEGLNVITIIYDFKDKKVIKPIDQDFVEEDIKMQINKSEKVERMANMKNTSQQFYLTHDFTKNKPFLQNSQNNNSNQEIGMNINSIEKNQFDIKNLENQRRNDLIEEEKIPANPNLKTGNNQYPMKKNYVLPGNNIKNRYSINDESNAIESVIIATVNPNIRSKSNINQDNQNKSLNSQQKQKDDNNRKKKYNINS